MAERLAELDDFWTQLAACHNDLPRLLAVIAERVVELIGDGCVLTTLAPDGRSLRAEVVRHADPEVELAMRPVLEFDVPFGEGLAGTVAADRRSILMNDLLPQTLAETTSSKFQPFVLEHPVRSIIIVPLLAAGDLVGTLGAFRTVSDRPYTTDDLRLLEGLAERAALALHDALAGPRTVGSEDFEAIYRYNLDGVLLVTPDGHVLAANPAACSMFGMSERDIIAAGRSGLTDMTDPRVAAMTKERSVSGRTRGEVTMRRGDGTTFEAALESMLYTSRDHGVRAVLILRDIDDEVRRRNEVASRISELEDVAEHDLLTGLWNRRGFRVAAEQALAAADRDRVTTQLVFLDVDGLKAINDEQGHAAGDASLQALARAIRHAVRQPDVACRYGGDEFVLLLATPGHEVGGIVDRITGELDLDEGPVPVTFSTGVAERLPGAADTLNELIDAADRAMYQEKVVRRLRLRSPGWTEPTP